MLLRLVDETCYYIVFMGIPSAVPYSRSVLLTGGRGGNLSNSKALEILLMTFKHICCRNYLRHELQFSVPWWTQRKPKKTLKKTTPNADS